jgi:hypothetical protein
MGAWHSICGIASTAFNFLPDFSGILLAAVGVALVVVPEAIQKIQHRKGLRWTIATVLVVLGGIGMGSSFVQHQKSDETITGLGNKLNGIGTKLDWIIQHPSSPAEKRAAIKIRDEIAAPTAPEQHPKPSSLPGTQPAVPIAAPTVATVAPPQQLSTPAMDSKVLCPEKGTLAVSWSLSRGLPWLPMGRPYQFNYTIQMDKLHPVLHSLPSSTTASLNAEQLIEAGDAVADITPRLDKPQPLVTSEGTVMTVNTVDIVNRPFSTNADSIGVGYSNETQQKFLIKHGSKDFSIGSLSDKTRRFFLSLDELAKNKADASCKETVHALTTKP